MHTYVHIWKMEKNGEHERTPDGHKENLQNFRQQPELRINPGT